MKPKREGKGEVRGRGGEGRRELGRLVHTLLLILYRILHVGRVLNGALAENQLLPATGEQQVCVY